MSLATLNKKSRRYKDNLSGKKHGFSINGGLRSLGWVGQETTSRHIIGTPFRGKEPIGHGGKYGQYNKSIINNNIINSNNPDIIKRSTMNTPGYLDVYR